MKSKWWARMGGEVESREKEEEEINCFKVCKKKRTVA
jgi:hypothetical protein